MNFASLLWGAKCYSVLFSAICCDRESTYSLEKLDGDCLWAVGISLVPAHLTVFSECSVMNLTLQSGEKQTLVLSQETQDVRLPFALMALERCGALYYITKWILKFAMHADVNTPWSVLGRRGSSLATSFLLSRAKYCSLLFFSNCTHF